MTSSVAVASQPNAKQSAQASSTNALCSGVSTGTNSGGFTAGVGPATASVSVDGYNGAQMVQVTCTGTVAAQSAKFQIEGNIDGQWVQLAVIKSSDSVSGVNLARALIGTDTLAIPAGLTISGLYLIYDAVKAVRINILANSLVTTGVTATVYLEPC